MLWQHTAWDLSTFKYPRKVSQRMGKLVGYLKDGQNVAKTRDLAYKFGTKCSKYSMCNSQEARENMGDSTYWTKYQQWEWVMADK